MRPVPSPGELMRWHNLTVQARIHCNLTPDVQDHTYTCKPKKSRLYLGFVRNINCDKLAIPSLGHGVSLGRLGHAVSLGHAASLGDAVPALHKPPEASSKRTSPHGMRLLHYSWMS